jgi:hypothetical protein
MDGVAVPPDNPDDWSDEQWLEWLNQTDAGSGDSAPTEVPLRRERSVGSRMLYAGMFGLREAIYGPQEQVTIVEEAEGSSEEPESLEVNLVVDHPEDSTVVVRPWLMEE